MFENLQTLLNDERVQFAISTYKWGAAIWALTKLTKESSAAEQAAALGTLVVLGLNQIAQNQKP